jgi:hypothetical protein
MAPVEEGLWSPTSNSDMLVRKAMAKWPTDSQFLVDKVPHTAGGFLFNHAEQ